jgi:predicted short-subunit dehydrogenase-like oxidoreductase (DUF2520 family)
MIAVSEQNRGDHMEIGFIGAGKVGFTLGKYFSKHGKEITGYFSRSKESAKEAAEFTGAEYFEDMGELIERSDVLFLTVPDSIITDVYREVVKYPVRGKLICHCSGALAARIAFPDIKEFGAYGYSVHPLFAVSSKYSSYEELADVFFAIDGDDERIEDIEGLLKSAWLHYQRIDGDSKIEYHCAAAIASNLMVGLMKESVDILERCGFSSEDAVAALAPLVRGNVQHMLEDGLQESLTGAVERCDFTTIQKHIDSFSKGEDASDFTREDEKMLYKLLSRKIVPIAEARHPERSYEEIKKLLNR